MNEQIHTSRSAVSSVRPRVIKVPRVTIAFWIVKILTTALGEATSDYLLHRFNPYFAVIGGFAVFSIAMLIQFAVSGFVPWAYWFAVAMVAVFGTMAADVLHVEFGVPYIVSTVFFAVALAVLFVTWYRSEGTLSIHSVNTRRREVFYWAAVLATFAMGTAAGDLAAYTARLGFLSAGLLFAVVFAIPTVAYRYFNANPILMFWFAYITTRPLGASFADWLGKARDRRRPRCWRRAGDRGPDGLDRRLRRLLHALPQRPAGRRGERSRRAGRSASRRPRTGPRRGRSHVNISGCDAKPRRSQSRRGGYQASTSIVTR